jgi:hypothetical protein
MNYKQEVEDANADVSGRRRGKVKTISALVVEGGQHKYLDSSRENGFRAEAIKMKTTRIEEALSS